MRYLIALFVAALLASCSAPPSDPLEPPYVLIAESPAVNPGNPHTEQTACVIVRDSAGNYYTDCTVWAAALSAMYQPGDTIR